MRRAEIHKEKRGLIVLKKQYIKDNIFIIWGFLIPFLVMQFVFTIMQMTPFGGYSLLVSDANVVYIDQLTGLRRMMLEGKGYFYTWSQIQGSTPFAFVQLSPFNLLTILFPESAILSVVTWIVMLKIASAGASFAYYLKKLFKRNDISISIFSWCFALMAYNIANHYHIIWLDQLILLPLVLWGVERILKDRKDYLFFTVMLSFSFITSFYLSYITGLFAFFYFIYRYLAKEKYYQIKDFLLKFIAFIKAPILAFGCTAIYLLPILLMMKGRDGLFQADNMILVLRYEFTELFSKLFIGSFDTFLPNGVPFLYCGLIVLIFIGFYFASYAISYKEKVLSFSLLSFMFLSLTINPLYVAWHGFKPPTYFEGRFSYLVSFMMIFLAYQAYHHIQTISNKHIHLVFGIIVGMTVLFNRTSYGYIKDNSLLYTLAFIAIYYIVLMLRKKEQYEKKQIALLLALVIGLELTVNTMLTIRSIDEAAEYPFASDYTEAYQQIETVTSGILEEDNELYRIEFVDKRGMNDGFGIGFPSISHFDSIYNYDVKAAVERLGVSTGHNWIQYRGTTPLVDTLLNIKYIICEEQNYFNYDYKYSVDYSRIFENPNNISLGFMIQDDLNQLEEEINPIKFQELLLNKMIGKTEKNYYIPIIPNKVVDKNVGLVEEQKVKKDNKEETYTVKHYYQKDSKQKAKLSYTIQAQEIGPCYLYVNSDQYYYTDVTVNEKSLGLSLLDMGDVYYLGDFKAGENIDVDLYLEQEYLDVNEVYFYQFDYVSFNKAVQELKQHALVVTKHTDTQIEGSIQVAEDKSILYLSIPYDKGWKLYVDGQEYSTQEVYGGFLGAKLNSGNHQIKLDYEPVGFKLGMMISVSTLTTIILFEIGGKRGYKGMKSIKHLEDIVKRQNNLNA